MRQNAMHYSIQDINQKRFNGYKKHIKNGRKCTIDGKISYLLSRKLYLYHVKNQKNDVLHIML